MSYKDVLKRIAGRRLTENVQYWKRLSLRKLLYLFHIVNPQEKRLLWALMIAVLGTGIGLVFSVYYATTKAAPAIAGTYIEGLLREPHSINPLYASQDTDRDIARLVYSGLLTYNGQGIVEPDLAEGYEVSSTGKVYTIRIRPTAQWHDGKQVTADDVVFTIHTIQNPKYKSVIRANWQGVNVEKIDDRTVRFTLRTPYEPFIENLTTGILPKHLWDGLEPEQALLNELNLKPIGSGPYRFYRVGQDSNGSILRYELERNPHYDRGGPYLKKIIFTFFHSEDEELVALRRGVIDGFGPVSTKHLLELNPNKISVVSIAMPRVFGVFFNLKKAPILEDKNIRQAISLALNRNEIARGTATSGAIPIQGPLPLFPTLTDVGKEVPTIYDPGEARRILEKDGWKAIDGNGIREKRIPGRGKSVITPLEFTLTTSDWPDLTRAAEAIQTMLREVGILVHIQKLPLEDLEANVIKPRNFEMLLFGQVYGYEPDPYAFWHSSQIKDPGLNVALFANRSTDRILEETRTLADRRERQARFEQFSILLQKEIPAVFLYSQLYLYLLPSDMHGAEITRISLPADRFNHIHQWYRKTTRVFLK